MLQESEKVPQPAEGYQKQKTAKNIFAPKLFFNKNIIEELNSKQLNRLGMPENATRNTQPQIDAQEEDKESFVEYLEPETLRQKLEQVKIKTKDTTILQENESLRNDNPRVRNNEQNTIPQQQKIQEEIVTQKDEKLFGEIFQPSQKSPPQRLLQRHEKNPEGIKQTLNSIFKKNLPASPPEIEYGVLQFIVGDAVLDRIDNQKILQLANSNQTLMFYSQQFAENIFAHIDFEGHTTFRTSFSRSLNPFKPVWNHSVKLDILDLENLYVTIRILTIVARIQIVLGEVQISCKELIGVNHPIPLFNQEKVLIGEITLKVHFTPGIILTQQNLYQALPNTNSFHTNIKPQSPTNAGAYISNENNMKKKMLNKNQSYQTLPISTSKLSGHQHLNQKLPLQRNGQQSVLSKVYNLQNQIDQYSKEGNLAKLRSP